MQKIFDISNSYREILRRTNMCEKGSSYNTLKSVIQNYNINLTKLNYNRIHTPNTSCKTLEFEDIFKKNSNYKGQGIKNRLFRLELKEKRCECCGLSSWNGLDIPLQLHHVDGDVHNNEIKNLQILCANCHSQTNNFTGKNMRKNINKSKKEKKGRIKKKVGLPEDGKRYYPGNGNYKVICPVCNKEYMHVSASKCMQCYLRERNSSKISKDILYKAMIENKNNATKVGKILNVDRESVTKWCRFYLKQDGFPEDLKYTSLS